LWGGKDHKVKRKNTSQITSQTPKEKIPRRSQKQKNACGLKKPTRGEIAKGKKLPAGRSGKGPAERKIKIQGWGNGSTKSRAPRWGNKKDHEKFFSIWTAGGRKKAV